MTVDYESVVRISTAGFVWVFCKLSPEQFAEGFVLALIGFSWWF
jgi:hypothetical protein